MKISQKEIDSEYVVNKSDLVRIRNVNGAKPREVTPQQIVDASNSVSILDVYANNVNYINNEGREALALFQPASSWTPGTGTPADETVIVRKAGNTATKLLANTTQTIIMTGENYYNFSPGNTANDGTPGDPSAYKDCINISIYCDNPLSGAQLSLWLSSNDGVPTAASRRFITIGGALTGVLMHGWTDFSIPLSAFTNDGNQTIDWNNIRSMDIRPNGNINTFCIIDNLYFSREATPSVVFVLDDASQSQYDHRNEFISRGIPISLAIDRNVIDTTALSTAQLQSWLGNDGNEGILHGNVKYSSLSTADLRAELDEAIEWNKNRGFKYDIAVYPNGTAYGPSPNNTLANHNIDQTVIEVLKTRAIRSARAINIHGGTVVGGNSFAYVSHGHGLARPFEVNSQAITSVGGAAPDISDSLAAIEYAKKNNVSIVFNLHAITTGVPVGNETTLSDLRLLLDSVKNDTDNGFLQSLNYSSFINNLDINGGMF